VGELERVASAGKGFRQQPVGAQLSRGDAALRTAAWK
jgi:hypothetical protein